MSLFSDYANFCAKVEGQVVTLTFVTHVASFPHLVDCKYKLKFTGNNSLKKLTISLFPIQKHMRPNLTLM